MKTFPESMERPVFQIGKVELNGSNIPAAPIAVQECTRRFKVALPSGHKEELTEHQLRILIKDCRAAIGRTPNYPDNDQAVQVIKLSVASIFKIPLDWLEGDSHEPQKAFPRQVAMTFCREFLAQSYVWIGRQFDRDHGTVMAAIRRVAAAEQTEPGKQGALVAAARALVADRLASTS